jgi:hypothetical protein
MYRPEKGNDYKFIDKNVYEMFQVSGTDILFHKYLGPGNPYNESPSTPIYSTQDPTQIQDLLFLENRDRKYAPDVFILRGVYSIQDIDFNLSQFGLFLQNDTIFVMFHINDTVERLGRKIISGDVIELPHLKDDFALNEFQYALKRFFVVEEVSRASEGFSVTWYPHLYRAKCKPLVDSQEFKDILDSLVDEENDSNTTLRDILSSYQKEIQITQGILNQAEFDAPKSGYDTTTFYTLKRKPNGIVDIYTIDSSLLINQTPALDNSGNPILDENGNPLYITLPIPPENYISYAGYLVGEGIPPDGAPFQSGIAFPLTPSIGQYYLRTDYSPNRLFMYDKHRKWIKIEDNVRMTMSNLGENDTRVGDIFAGKDVRETLRTSFINNTNSAVIDGQLVPEKQTLSTALRPQPDY